MAVPSSPDPRSRGRNQLIREGATLAQNAAEIAELVNPIDFRVKPMKPQPISRPDGLVRNRARRKIGTRRARQSAFSRLNFWS